MFMSWKTKYIEYINSSQIAIKGNYNSYQHFNKGSCRHRQISSNMYM